MREYLIKIMEFLKGVYKTVTTFQHHDFNYNTGEAAPPYFLPLVVEFSTHVRKLKATIQRYIIVCKAF